MLGLQFFGLSLRLFQEVLKLYIIECSVDPNRYGFLVHLQKLDIQWSGLPKKTQLNGPNITPLHQLNVRVAWGDAGRPRQVELATVLPQRAPIPGAAVR